MAPRIYTLAEARALVPRIAGLLAALQDAKRQLQQTQELRHALERSAGSDGDGRLTDPPTLERHAQDWLGAFRASLETFHELDIQVKDIDRGLVDLTAEREGRLVLLCWEQGEATIDWWHELDTGYAGRQRIRPADWDVRPP